MSTIVYAVFCKRYTWWQWEEEDAMDAIVEIMTVGLVSASLHRTGISSESRWYVKGNGGDGGYGDDARWWQWDRGQ